MEIEENKYLTKFVQLAKEYDFQENEIVKEIKDFYANERYYLSNYGNAFSLCGKKWRKLNPAKDSKGYLFFTIRYKDKKKIEHKKDYYIHRNVALLFVPNEDDKRKTIVHHKDGNKLNNYYQNLVWVDDKEHSKLHIELNQQKTQQAVAEDGL